MAGGTGASLGEPRQFWPPSTDAAAGTYALGYELAKYELMARSRSPILVAVCGGCGSSANASAASSARPATLATGRLVPRSSSSQ
ncbi:hypothetical protein MTO96_020374 [Rhipicephalus appendiculatus]